MAVDLSKSRDQFFKLGIHAELTYRWRSEHLEKPEGSITGHGKVRHIVNRSAS
ncbi:transposase [Pontibacter akesuensis]|uniref:Transposase n=1 Tax=Pontibacter akesuensis TaxID=388950 RepID=A0A1I7FKQ6_9BACT|nr:transposase [Pontibacter akesuensis]